MDRLREVFHRIARELPTIGMEVSGNDDDGYWARTPGGTPVWSAVSRDNAIRGAELQRQERLKADAERKKRAWF